MQNLKSRRKLSRRSVILARGKLRHFSQSNRRKEQKGEPGSAPDVASRRAEKDPRYTSNDKNNECRDPPASINWAGTPGTCEDKKGRNYREKKKDVIEVHLFERHCNVARVTTLQP